MSDPVESVGDRGPEAEGGPTARFFRLTVTAAHTAEQIDRLIDGLSKHLGG